MTREELESILCNSNNTVISPVVAITQPISGYGQYISYGRLTLSRNEDYNPQTATEDPMWTAHYIIQAVFDVLPNGKVGYNDEHPEFDGAETIDEALAILAVHGVQPETLELWDENKHQASEDEWRAWHAKLDARA